MTIGVHSDNHAIDRFQSAPPRRAALVGLLIAGVLLWVLSDRDMPWYRWAVVGSAVALSLLPPINRALWRLLDRLRHLSCRQVEWTGLLIGVAATCYLIATAFVQERDLRPKTSDECSYLLGTQMMAHGRLWMPQHPLADFFESFYLFHKPVYCSFYFPGSALLNAPMIWFGWPSWTIPVVASGMIVGLIYRIMTELVDGVAGILAALWLVSLQWFRTLSMMVMSHNPTLLLGLLMIWAWLRWRHGHRWGPALAIGIFAGLAAITRPADSLAYAIPVGAAMILSLRREPLRKWLTTGATLVGGALPFLALQAVFNSGVTGHLLETPYSTYLRQTQPGSEFGFRPYDPAARSISTLPQKIAMQAWAEAYVKHHQPHNFYQPWFRPQELAGGRIQASNFQTIAETTLPGRLLLVLVPAGLLAMTGRRWVLATTLPAFIFVYLFNPLFLEHYPLCVAPALMLLVLLGCGAIASAWPRWSRQIGVSLTVGVAMLSLTALPEVRHFMPMRILPARDGMLEGDEFGLTLQGIDLAVAPPALILFNTPNSVFHEAVFNWDVIWPDDAPIIKAQDLGPRNREIIEYYAQRQPSRMFYHFDWHGGGIARLGTARELAEKLRAGANVEAIVNPRQ